MDGKGELYIAVTTWTVYHRADLYHIIIFRKADTCFFQIHCNTCREGKTLSGACFSYIGVQMLIAHAECVLSISVIVTTPCPLSTLIWLCRSLVLARIILNDSSSSTTQSSKTVKLSHTIGAQAAKVKMVV